MATSSNAPFLRAAIGSVWLMSGLLLLSACGTVGSSQSDTTPTLRLTAFDSTSGEPLDSARAVNRTFGDTMRTDSAGAFVMRDVEPALYVFDVGGYGYHTQRHVSALVEPQDTTVSTDVPILPQQLSLSCEASRPYSWDGMMSEYQEDSTNVRIQLLDVFAQNGKVNVQPVVVNDLPTTTIFVPNNLGALGHYEVRLFDGDNNRIPYRYENAPRDEGHRIYSKGEILPVVPSDTERLEPTRLILEDSLEEGTTLYARLDYTFSTDDTLEATSATTFPELGLDSLQVPVFDTLRTAGEVEVPDSLVLQRDTTVMRVEGIDTTVTRSGYLLFSTLRQSNAAATPEAARDLLYVPDSVKARARRDSLLAEAATNTTVPSIDTSALGGSSTNFYIVDRTDNARLNSLITDEVLAQSLAQGLPVPAVTADSLLSMSETLRGAFLQSPSLSTRRTRRGLTTEPDSVFQDSLLLSAPRSDSLFEMIAPDSLAVPDSGETDSVITPFVDVGPLSLRSPEIDSIPVDSLPLTVSPLADSVVETSVLDEDLRTPPDRTYWSVPDSLSQWQSEVMVVDPSFFRLRARPQIDTTAGLNIASLLPDRIGTPDRQFTERFPQQVIRSPAGTYRAKYLETWREMQASNLKGHYCQIFPFPLRTEWRSTSMMY